MVTLGKTGIELQEQLRAQQTTYNRNPTLGSLVALEMKEEEFETAENADKVEQQEVRAGKQQSQVSIKEEKEHDDIVWSKIHEQANTTVPAGRPNNRERQLAKAQGQAAKARKLAQDAKDHFLPNVGRLEQNAKAAADKVAQLQLAAEVAQDKKMQQKGGMEATDPDQVKAAQERATRMSEMRLQRESEVRGHEEEIYRLQEEICQHAEGILRSEREVRGREGEIYRLQTENRRYAEGIRQCEVAICGTVEGIRRLEEENCRYAEGIRQSKVAIRGNVEDIDRLKEEIRRRPRIVQDSPYALLHSQSIKQEIGEERADDVGVRKRHRIN